MILDDIVEVKHREVVERKQTTPLSTLTAIIGRMPQTRDFRRALSGENCSIIAEVKRRSPSRGIIREDFDPVRIAREYERHGAAAVSVLTDEAFFGGSDADLTAVKNAISCRFSGKSSSSTSGRSMRRGRSAPTLSCSSQLSSGRINSGNIVKSPLL